MHIHNLEAQPHTSHLHIPPHNLFYHPNQTLIRILAHCALTYTCTQSYIMQMDPNGISVHSALTYMGTHLYVIQLDPSKYSYMSCRWIPVPVHLCQRTEQSVSYSRHGSVPAAVSGLFHLCRLVLSVVCRNWGHGDTPSAHISAMEKISSNKVFDSVWHKISKWHAQNCLNYKGLLQYLWMEEKCVRKHKTITNKKRRKKRG